MEWKHISNEKPPVGEKILITNPNNSLQIAKLGYQFEILNIEQQYFRTMSEKDLVEADFHWLLIPELPTKTK